MVPFRAQKPFYRKSARPSDAEREAADTKARFFAMLLAEPNKAQEEDKLQAYLAAGPRVISAFVKFEKLQQEGRGLVWGAADAQIRPPKTGFSTEASSRITLS